MSLLLWFGLPFFYQKNSNHLTLILSPLALSPLSFGVEVSRNGMEWRERGEQKPWVWWIRCGGLVPSTVLPCASVRPKGDISCRPNRPNKNTDASGMWLVEIYHICLENLWAKLTTHTNPMPTNIFLARISVKTFCFSKSVQHYLAHSPPRFRVR